MLASLSLDVRPDRMNRAGLTPEREQEILKAFLLDLRGETRISDFKLVGVDIWDHLVTEQSALYTDVFSVTRAEKGLPEEMREGFFRFVKRGLTNDVELPGFVKAPHIDHGQGSWVDEDAERLAHAYLDIKGCEGGSRELIDGVIQAGKGPITNIGFAKLLSAGLEPDQTALVEIRIPMKGVKNFRVTVEPITSVSEEDYLEYLISTKQAYDFETAKKMTEGTQVLRNRFGFGIRTHFWLALEENALGHSEALFMAGLFNNIIRRLTQTVLVESSFDTEYEGDNLYADNTYAYEQGSDVVFIEPTLGNGLQAMRHLDPLIFQLLSSEEETSSDE